MSLCDIRNSIHTEAFLVSHPANIQYLTGVNADGSLLLMRSHGCTLFVYALEEEIAKKNVQKGVCVRLMPAFEKIFKNIRSCGIESDRISIETFMNWKRKYKNTKFVRYVGIIERFRRQKSPKELQNIRFALSITEQLLSDVAKQMKRFPTEKELAWMLECQARELGADGMAFESIVAFGSNTSRPHHRPTDRRLKKGDIVQVDIGARYKGYCADRSEVYFAAKPTSLQQRIYDAVREAKEEAKAAVKFGVMTHTLDQIARKVLRKHGFEKYFCHGLGHGVGLEIHEGVSISSKGPDIPLLKNEVITIEPGVYIPGKFGIRLEDMVFV
ncbi:M24 family metallopeptidase [Candidatus Peregrinibacteria bacterium]|nr:M24 family metallopeptidase [Candidatus Peregrinibacteria bacterium]